MEENAPLPRPFANKPLQTDALHAAIAGALLQFDESIDLIREQPNQGERAHIDLPDSSD